uniref:SCP domain-containing protein n=1 Tax=Meloidogyne hapla TaxID=6305 RepID=A0A1I8BVY7_MELHA
MTVSSGPSASRGKKKHFLNKFVVRKNCYGIFILSEKIFNANNRKHRLANRSKFEAFFQSACPLYPNVNGSMPDFDYSYCNRYCEKNEHMEFMYRVIQFPENKSDIKVNKFGKSQNVQCPHYVVLRSCQCDKYKNGTKIGALCEAKKFNKEFISIKDGNSKKLGICIPCDDDSEDSKISKTIEITAKTNG